MSWRQPGIPTTDTDSHSGIRDLIKYFSTRHISIISRLWVPSQCKDPRPSSRAGCSSWEDLLLLQRKIKRFLKPAFLGSCQTHLTVTYWESKLSFQKQQPDNNLCSQTLQMISADIPALAEVRAQYVVDGASCNDQWDGSMLQIFPAAKLIKIARTQCHKSQHFLEWQIFMHNCVVLWIILFSSHFHTY